MKTIKCVFTTVASISTLFLCGHLISRGSNAQPGYQNEAIACNVLTRLSQNSKSWAEVVAYKNAFDLVKSRVGQKNAIAEDEKYFKRLVELNAKTRHVFCMYLDKEPKNNCGFRNLETDNLLEIIERKMKKDHLSMEDIIRAIENAQAEKNPGKFIPLNRD